MADEKLDPDFAALPLAVRAEIEGLSGAGLHNAPAAVDERGTDEAFHHPERDAAGTTWEPNWEPIETYRDGEVVMLDDGDRQLLGKREMGMWMELVGSDELAQPDYLPMLWSSAPAQVKNDMLSSGGPLGGPDPQQEAAPMFIAMNRFQVIPGEETAFEDVWLSRDSHLAGVPGFVEFHMLRGPAAEDHVLYSSHTIWRSREDFEASTRSEAFRAAHRGAGNHKPLYLGPPHFEGFEVIQTVAAT